MRKKYGTRGVIRTWANPDGTQKIESTGPLNKKRMETIDDEVTKETIRFMTDAKKAGKPFFLWAVSLDNVLRALETPGGN